MDNHSPTFQTSINGKWILAGEHAVLRGHPAIIFPVKCKTLTLKYWASDEEVRAEFAGDFGEEMSFLFWSTLERATQILNLHHSDLKGNFHLTNHIPIGTGMGASAALCVAVGRWLVEQNKVPQEHLLEFARQLENLFHNESSGADIAVAIAGQGIFFSRSGGLHPIKTMWEPQWYLSFSDKVSTTSRCVQKVKALWKKKPEFAQEIDQDMADSVALAAKALTLTPQEGLPNLITAVDKARSCFQRWGLIEGNIEHHITSLLDAGALAAKPTGSGNGGYVLSLWDKPPTCDLGFEMIPV